MVFSAIISTVVSIFYFLANPIRIQHPETIDPAGSWPALELDASVQNDGFEISVPTEYAGNMTIYHVVPQNPSTKAIIVNYDINGMNMGRLRSVCDQLAQDTGFHVIMPDFFRNGDGIMNYGGFPFTDAGFMWFAQFNSQRVLNDTNVVYEYMKDAGYKIDSYGSTGYCWGAWAGLWQGTTGQLSAHVSAHPSYQVEDFIGSGLQNLTLAVNTPVMIIAAGNDPETVKSGGVVESWLQSAGNYVEIVEFPEMEHGWVPRGNVSIPAVAEGVQGALKNTVEFFQKFL